MVGDTVGFRYDCDWNIQFFDLFLEKLRFLCHTASEKVYDFDIVIAYHTFRTQFKQVVSLRKAAQKLIAVCALLIGSQDNLLFAHIDRAENGVFTDFSFFLVHIHTSAYFNHNSDVSAVAATALP